MMYESNELVRSGTHRSLKIVSETTGALRLPKPYRYTVPVLAAWHMVIWCMGDWRQDGTYAASRGSAAGASGLRMVA